MPTNTDEERAAAAQIATFGNPETATSSRWPPGRRRSATPLDSPIASGLEVDHDTDAYYKIARAFVDGQPSGNLTDQILDNIMLYWLSGTGASAARSYGRPTVPTPRPQALRPAARRSRSASRLPGRDLADAAQLGRGAIPERIYFNEVDKGGHFAAWEEPEVFSEEMRDAFRAVRNRGGMT